MKPLLLCVFILFSLNSYTQPDELESRLSKIVKEYLAFTDFIKGSANRDLTYIEIAGAKDYYERAKPFMDVVEKNANPLMVKTAFYIRISMLIDLGGWYAIKGMNQTAYEYLASAQLGMEYFFDAQLFPIIFRDGNLKYTMAWEDFRIAYPRYYRNLGDVCLRLSKPEEAREWYYKQLTNVFSTDWDKYTAVCGVLNSKAKLNQEDGELLDLVIRVAKIIARLDSSELDDIRQNKSFDLNTCYTVMKLLLEKHPDFSSNGKVYSEFATILKDANEPSKASEFYQLAMDNGYGDLNVLKEAYISALKAGNTKRSEMVLAKLDSLLALNEIEDKGVQYFMIGNELTQFQSIEKAFPFYIKSLAAGYDDIENIINLLKATVDLNNSELLNAIANELRQILMLRSNNIEGLSAMMDGAVLLKDRNMESDIIDKLEAKFSKMKLAEQCNYASLMELRYDGWGYHSYAEKWLQKIIKCNKKHL